MTRGKFLPADRVAAAAQVTPSTTKDAANLPQPKFQEGTPPLTETPKKKKKRKHSEMEAAASAELPAQLQKPPPGREPGQEKCKQLSMPKAAELWDEELSNGVVGFASDLAEKRKRKKEKRIAETANEKMNGSLVGMENKLEDWKRMSGIKAREVLSSPMQRNISISSGERERTKSDKKRKKTKAA